MAGKSSNAGPATAVEVARVQTSRLAQSITAVGSLRSDESVIVRPEVAGRIAEIHFREGQPVVKGSTMVVFDASVQRAELEQAQANLTLSKSKLDRAIDLQKKGFISSQAREEAENSHRVSQAAYDLASARLTKLEIKAPFSGIVGLRLVSIGDYVKDGQDIVNLEGVDPLKVDFKVPELYLKQVAVGQALQINLDAFPNQYYEGRVFAINPLVDQGGRSIVIRAVIRNGEARLRPGMFARVRLLLNDNRDSLLIPEQALIPQGDDKYVYRVIDNRVMRVKVDVGQRREGKAEILQGLSADDVIVTAGQTKIRDGAQVRIAELPSQAPRTAEQDKIGLPPPASAARGKT
jgi:membrane fusion protein (multidrug efflux system)